MVYCLRSLIIKNGVFMRSMRKYLMMFFTLTVIGSALSAQTLIYDGVQKGKWTMDYDAALKYAQKHKMPVFLKFTGSDWCVWCKLMEKNVFTKDKWLDFAKEKILLVTLDFPRNQEIVPQKYRERNKKGWIKASDIQPPKKSWLAWIFE